MSDTTDLMSNIWTEKYRPSSLDECLLNASLKQKFVELKKLSHFIFYGEYGVGKTSVARILAKRFCPDDILEINAADENGIDTVRHKISEFMSYHSMSAPHKVIILNEASYLTKQAQEALRSPLEEYSESCRFIFTANDVNAIDDAIRSRCHEYEFVPPNIKEVGQLIWNIGKKEGIELSTDMRKDVVKLIKAYFPDLRKTINEFEKCCLSGSFIWEEADSWMEELYEKISTKVPHIEIRTWFIQNHFTRALNFTNIYQFLFRKFMNMDDVVLLVAEFMDKKVIDEEINFAAFLIRMERLLQK